jgi:hypothetical protein
MMDLAYVAVMAGLFLASIFGLGLFNRGRGEGAGRED